MKKESEKKYNEMREKNFMRSYWEDKDRIHLPESKTKAQSKAIKNWKKDPNDVRHLVENTKNWENKAFERMSREGFNPFKLVTHINGKRIK